jgi:hypothetical protein
MVNDNIQWETKKRYLPRTSKHVRSIAETTGFFLTGKPYRARSKVTLTQNLAIVNGKC